MIEIGHNSIKYRHLSIYIDKEDFDLVSKYNWTISKSDKILYAKTIIYGPIKERIYMHRLIMGISNRHAFIDHKDTNGLNNCRANLRIVDNTKNQMNSRVREHSSKFKGVSWNPKNNNWTAQIHVNKKKVHIGCFADEIEAARVYNEHAIKYFGEYGRLNNV